MASLAVIQKPRRRLGRVLSAVLLALLVLLLVLTGWCYLKLSASLPLLEGQIPLAGLSAPVAIERDALGIPTISAEDRLDAARATGFVHAQDRFFQMDLLRRQAAGELAALLGEAALTVDRTVRIHRFRARARQVMVSLPQQRQQLLEAYTRGVNAGLAQLQAPPFEYLLLGLEPLPWSPEDSLLTIYAMYLELQDDQWPRESARGTMHDLLPGSLYRFLVPRGTEWDAPIRGSAFETSPLPGPEVIDLRSEPPKPLTISVDDGLFDETVRQSIEGSNNWAVTGAHTVHGGALLANDMHLGLAVPNIWYRMSLIYPDDTGQRRRITGITLPGTPAMVIGSNGRIAWGFTNANGDWSDLINLESAENVPDRYRTPRGWQRIRYHQETIRIRGGGQETLRIPWTHWGPVIDRDHRGRQRVLRWVAYDQRGVNLEFLDLETANTVEEALEVANRAGLPAQNFLVADSKGNIGWTLMGPIPRRFGYEGRVPRSWADGSRGWDGWLPVDHYPRIVNPVHGRLWTANARVVDGIDWIRLGNGGYDLGARAQQIRDALFAVEIIDEPAMLALQLDDRALFLERWRNLLLEVLTPQAVAADPKRLALRRIVENWRARAAVDAVGFRLVRAFRLVVMKQVFAPLVAACAAADPAFDYGFIKQREGPLWRLVENRPVHLLDPRFGSWQTLLLAAVDEVIGHFTNDGFRLEEHPWGAHNTVRIRHPFSRFVPVIGYWLDMPAVPLPGALHMPRVQTPTHSASQRMVVAPGHEAQGIFHMPVGQSGHPLSPYYRKGHKDWVEGRPSAFLPSAAEHVLTLIPMLGKMDH